MKKLSFFVCILGLLFLVTGCGNKLSTYEEINYTKLNEKIEKKDDFILFIGSYKCSACSVYKETLNKVIKDKQVKVYYLDVGKITEEENKKLLDQINYDNVTPTTVFIKGGIEENIYNRLVGAKGYDKTIEAFVKNGFLKEK